MHHVTAFLMLSVKTLPRLRRFVTAFRHTFLPTTACVSHENLVMEAYVNRIMSALSMLHVTLLLVAGVMKIATTAAVLASSVLSGMRCVIEVSKTSACPSESALMDVANAARETSNISMGHAYHLSSTTKRVTCSTTIHSSVGMELIVSSDLMTLILFAPVT